MYTLTPIVSIGHKIDLFSSLLHMVCPLSLIKKNHLIKCARFPFPNKGYGYNNKTLISPMLYFSYPIYKTYWGNPGNIHGKGNYKLAVGAFIGGLRNNVNPRLPGSLLCLTRSCSGLYHAVFLVAFVVLCEILAYTKKLSGKSLCKFIAEQIFYYRMKYGA